MTYRDESVDGLKQQVAKLEQQLASDASAERVMARKALAFVSIAFAAVVSIILLVAGTVWFSCDQNRKGAAFVAASTAVLLVSRRLLGGRWSW